MKRGKEVSKTSHKLKELKGSKFDNKYSDKSSHKRQKRPRIVDDAGPSDSDSELQEIENSAKKVKTKQKNITQDYKVPDNNSDIKQDSEELIESDDESSSDDDGEHEVNKGGRTNVSIKANNSKDDGEDDDETDDESDSSSDSKKEVNKGEKGGRSNISLTADNNKEDSEDDDETDDESSSDDDSEQEGNKSGKGGRSNISLTADSNKEDSEDDDETNDESSSDDDSEQEGNKSGKGGRTNVSLKANNNNEENEDDDDAESSSDDGSEHEVNEGVSLIAYNNEDDGEDENDEDDDDDDDDDEKVESDDAVNDNLDKAGENAIEEQYSAIRKELADIPFEDLLKIKEKVGVKAFNKIMQGNMEGKQENKVFKRDNKRRPREMSSKRPIPAFKRMKRTETRTSRDPRFDDLSGEFKDHYFNKNYSFVEEIKEKERKTVAKKLKKEKNANKKVELKGLLNRMQQEQQVKAMKKKREDLEKTYREKEKELVKEGKTPFFLKKSDKKTLELAMKFKELKQSGRLDKYMSKKRKKVAQKQRKKMPSNQ